MKRFFSYTGEWTGFDRHETAEAARIALQGAIDELDETWDPDHTRTWCWGEVHEVATVAVVHVHDDECMGEDGCWVGYECPEEGQECAEVSLTEVPNPEADALRSEVERLRAELAQAQAEIADLRAQVAAPRSPPLDGLTQPPALVFTLEDGVRLTPGDRVRLRWGPGREPEVVEYLGRVGGLAVVIGADGKQTLVSFERVSAMPMTMRGE